MKKSTYIFIVLSLLSIGCRKKVENNPGPHPQNYGEQGPYEIVHKEAFEDKSAIRKMFAFDDELYILRNIDSPEAPLFSVLLEDNTLIHPTKNIQDIKSTDFPSYKFDLIEDAYAHNGTIYFGGILNYNDEDHFYLEYNTSNHSINAGENLASHNMDGIKTLMKYQNDVIAFSEDYNNDFNCLSCPTSYGVYPNIINTDLYNAITINDTFYMQTPQGKVYYTDDVASPFFTGLTMAQTDTVVHMFEYKNRLCAIGSFENGSISLMSYNFTNDEFEPMAPNSDVLGYLSVNFGQAYGNQYHPYNVPTVRVIDDEIYIIGIVFIKNSLGAYEQKYATLRYSNANLEVIDTKFFLKDIVKVNGQLYGAIFSGTFLAKLYF